VHKIHLLLLHLDQTQFLVLSHQLVVEEAELTVVLVLTVAVVVQVVIKVVHQLLLVQALQVKDMLVELA
jgi:hypothetical protein